MGIAIRTGSPLSLNLAEPVWKQLAGMALTPADITEVNIHKILIIFFFFFFFFIHTFFVACFTCISCYCKNTTHSVM